MPALSGHRAGIAPPIAIPPVHHDVNPVESSHRPDEVVVQILIVELDHDQEPETGQWSSARLRQEVFQVSLAESVRFVRVVQRLARPEIRR